MAKRATKKKTTQRKKPTAKPKARATRKPAANKPKTAPPPQAERDWRTLQELADKLGVSRWTLNTYRKAKGFPEGRPVAEVETWVASYKLGTGAGASADDALTPAQVKRRKAIAQMRKAEEDALLAELERKKTDGELIQVAEVVSTWQRNVNAMKQRLETVGAEVAQTLSELLSNPEDAPTLEDAVDSRIRKILQEAFESRGLPSSQTT